MVSSPKKSAGLATVRCSAFLGLPLCSFRLYSEPDPVFGHRKPGIAIFRLSSASSALQAFLSMLVIAISVGGHTQPQKIN
jgi:hypothetical protein